MSKAVIVLKDGFPVCVFTDDPTLQVVTLDCSQTEGSIDDPDCFEGITAFPLPADLDILEHDLQLSEDRRLSETPPALIPSSSAIPDQTRSCPTPAFDAWTPSVHSPIRVREIFRIIETLFQSRLAHSENTDDVLPSTADSDS